MPITTKRHGDARFGLPRPHSGNCVLAEWGRVTRVLLMGCAAAACSGHARAYGAGAEGFVLGGNNFCSTGVERVIDGGSSATSAFAQTKFVDACHFQGFANGEASLSPGFLKAHAKAFGNGGSQGHASLDIVVNLQGPRGATRVKDTWEMVISGVMTPPIRPPGSAFDYPTSTWEACISANVPGIDGFVRSVDCFDQVIGNGAFSQTITLDIDAPAVGGRVDGIYVRFSIAAHALGGLTPRGLRYGGEADLRHTALIRHTLPPDWTSTADYSDFLATSPLSPVPEPAPTALLGCGLALLMVHRLRQKREVERTTGCGPAARAA